MVSSQVRVRIPWDYPFGGFHSHGGAPIAGWFFPHIIVWGSCFWICTSRLGRLLRLLLLLLRHTHSLSHTIFHTQLCHTTTLSHTIFHTHLSHTPLSHTVLTHLFHKLSFTHHLCHTPSLPHTTFVTCNFVTHTQIFTYKCLSDRSSSTSYIYPSFPIPLDPLFLILGRS